MDGVLYAGYMDYQFVLPYKSGGPPKVRINCQKITVMAYIYELSMLIIGSYSV